MLRHKNLFFLFVTIILLSGEVLGQSVPYGFNYQTTLRDNSGIVIPNHAIDIRFTIYRNSPTGIPVWQEIQSCVTDSYGHIRTVLGIGVNTGNSSLLLFNQIQWHNDIYFLNVAVDTLSGSGFVDHGIQQFFSVPYTFYSKKAGIKDGLTLAELNDVDVLVVNSGDLLKWNGNYWIPGLDQHSDSVLYAHEVNVASTSDTTAYWISNSVPDSVPF
ncbi:MAG: hypothetical protein L6Q66_07425, partial [Bacteroidia bacterium]|nr:hypothetical protein [Bacteroidia bacterium]